MGAYITNPIVNPFSGPPLASLYKSPAILKPYISRNKLKPISIISYRPENAAYPHLGYCGLVFNYNVSLILVVSAATSIRPFYRGTFSIFTV